MNKFEDSRVTRTEIESTHFIHPIPVALVKPKQETDESVVFIFNGGLGSSIPLCLYMNNDLFDHNYFVTYEKAFHNDNKNKPSQFVKPYLRELDEVVDWVAKQYPNKRIYLLGESWGTTLSFVYYKRNKNKITGVIGWNTPFAIVNPEGKPLKEILSITFKEITTLLFNIELSLPNVQAEQTKFSQNKILNRLLNVVPPVKSSTRTSLSIWKLMKRAFRFVCRYGKNPNYNFLYIQSGEDVMANWRKIRKIEKHVDDKHYIKFPTGYHVLSMEPKESIDLFKVIFDYIKH